MFTQYRYRRAVRVRLRAITLPPVHTSVPPVPTSWRQRAATRLWCAKVARRGLWLWLLTIAVLGALTLYPATLPATTATPATSPTLSAPNRHLASLAASAQAPMGKPYPAGYGHNPCVTLQYQMATTQSVVTTRQWFYNLNHIGCNGVGHKGTRCTRGAYHVAAYLARHGANLLTATAGSGAATYNAVVGNTYNCVLAPSGAWLPQ